ncbi:hypothetical protein LIER_08415 [Lithospermum erythrorhizon]|uniref:Uncharacterized protein n=1 Tax=Lithospermum erythrorhizon TaxID=34254 RepID=A0AAV3PBY6_LITER
MHKTQQGRWIIHIYRYVALFQSQRDSRKIQKSSTLTMSYPSTTPFTTKYVTGGNPRIMSSKLPTPWAIALGVRILKANLKGVAIKHKGTSKRAPISAAAKFITDIKLSPTKAAATVTDFRRAHSML